MSMGYSVRPCFIGMMVLWCTTSSRCGLIRSGANVVSAQSTTRTTRSRLKTSTPLHHFSSPQSSSTLSFVSSSKWSNKRIPNTPAAWIALPFGRHAEPTSFTTTLMGSLRRFRARRIPAVAAWTTNTQEASSETFTSSNPQNSLDHLPLVTQQRWRAPPTNQLLLQWKGEAREGYSHEFRQLEFMTALQAVVTGSDSSSSSVLPNISFTNALEYAGSTENMTDYHVEGFNQAFQYLNIHSNDGNSDKSSPITLWQFRQAVERCALVRALYEVVATSDSIDGLAPEALENDAFYDIQSQQRQTKKDASKGEPINTDGIQQADETSQTFISWCVRVRHFHEYNNQDDESSISSSSSSSSDSANGKERRYSARTTQSFSMERPVLNALTPLLLTFGGKVDLQNPDCKIYVFDGLEPNQCKMLARELAVGPKISFIAPATRICVTTTPLCPIAAYLLCNVARVRDGDTVLDPFAGSCTTLLAATMMAPQCQTVGIEIAHNGEVNRDDVLLDFQTRNFRPPVALIRGDCTEAAIRDQARASITATNSTSTTSTTDKGSFDVIITDPPYGIREKMSDATNGSPISPLEALFAAMAQDRRDAKPLLKQGGRLVAYYPCRPNETLADLVPTEVQAADAGLVLFETREQKIRDTLSRWLVAYESRLD